MNLREGAMVVLAPFEDQPREIGRVMGTPREGDDTVIVEVTSTEPGDDGLREVPFDQILDVVPEERELIVYIKTMNSDPAWHRAEADRFRRSHKHLSGELARAHEQAAQELESGDGSLS